ncbi:MAG: hypothetical protein ACPLRX_08175 [Candidatus Saccharicenans sp.]
MDTRRVIKVYSLCDERCLCHLTVNSAVCPFKEKLACLSNGHNNNVPF